MAKLTDTDKELEAVTPHPSDSSERMRVIARREARAVFQEGMNHCQNEGPLARVWEEIEKMRNTESAIKLEQAELRGAAAEAARKNVRMIGLLSALAGASTIASFLINHWPHR